MTIRSFKLGGPTENAGGTRAFHLFLASASVIAFSVTGASGQVNVALNQPVSLVSGSVNGAALSTITDGVFLASGQQWQSGTVWWRGLLPMLEIDLGGAFLIESAIVQADNNDIYELQYRDMNTGLFSPLWSVPLSSGGGMRTRPNVADDTERYFFPGGAVTTDRLRIAAVSGDDSYSVSEVQVFTIPAPFASVLLGFGGLIVSGRRRRAAAV